MDYAGNDLAVVQGVRDSWACQALCKDLEGCKFFTFDLDGPRPGRSPPTGPCYLKSSDAGRRCVGGSISGGVECRGGNQTSEFGKIGFFG